MAVRLVVDSGSDINQEEAKKLGITLIPIELRLNDVDYKDGVDITYEEFYNQLAKCITLPKTSQITPIRYQELFDSIVEAGDEAVIVCLSSKLSGTYNSAKMTAENYNGKIHVVDSMNACIGQRILTFYALELLKQGKSAKEIAESLEKVKGKIKLHAVIDTLKYLKMGGRVSSITAFAGEMLSIKPLIGVIDGQVKVIGKAFGTKKAYKQIIDLCKKDDINYNMPLVFGYAGNDKTSVESFSNDIISSVSDKFSKEQTYNIGATIGTHIGPGAVAVAYFEK